MGLCYSPEWYADGSSAEVCEWVSMHEDVRLQDALVFRLCKAS